MVFCWNVSEQDLRQSHSSRQCFLFCPKKGDQALLKNWRAVAFLCRDYKELPRALANRFKDLEIIVNTDQTYCVPDSAIMDFLLIQDVIDVCKYYKCAVESFDQENTFGLGWFIV